MKAYPLLYLSLSSFLTICACTPSRNAQAQQLKEMEKKELKMLEDSQPKSEEEAMENFYTPSHEGLINWVLTDTATFSYPFTHSIEKEYVTIATSEDKRLRIYSWNTGEGGTMILWGNLIQYRSGDSIRSFHLSLDMLLHPDGYHDEIDYGSCIDTIYTIPRADGSMLYLADDYFRMASNYSASSLVPMQIKDGKLVDVPCFVRDGERRAGVGFEHSIADWYFLANMGEGWDWLFRYNKETQNLYVGTTDDINCITDRYDIYHFNGTDFIYQKTGAPFWLHPQLQNYQRLELLFKTKDYMIRIDRLDGETMRYASWKSTQQMLDAPELVLTGVYREKDNTFLFSKGSYRYIVTLGDRTTLEVQQDGKTILKQAQESIEG